MRNPLMQNWLDGYCDTNEGVAGATVVTRDQDDGNLAVAAERTATESQRKQLAEAARAVHQTGAPRLFDVSENASPDSQQTQVVSLPIDSKEGVVGSVALELNTQPDTAQLAIADLERSAATIAAALSSQSKANALADSSVLLELQATILDHESFDEAATAFVTGLASKFQLERVSIGFLDQNYTSVTAVSRSADFHSKAELFRALGEAMDEAIEQGATISFPDCLKPRITAVHAEFVRRHGGALCTIPLVSRGEVFGALALERSGKTPFNEEEIARMEDAACILGPILELRHKQEKPWHQHLIHTARKLRARIFGAGHWQTKAAVYGGALLLAGLLLIPTEHWIGSPARVEGSIQRSISAPVDGYLQKSYVKPGDLVSVGQVMAELAEQDLQLEIRQLESELAQHENTYSAALVRSDRTEFVIAQAKADEVRARLGLLQQQLARSRVVAPFDGIVIQGDLSQSIGAPVEKGQVLLMVAPVDEFRLIVEVDERDIADIRIEEDGALALAALPNDTLSFKVERITPVASNREGRNFFEVEGKLNSFPPSMRPGLKGVAKIKSVDRSLLWIWTHRFIDWLRIATWSIGA